MSEPLHDETGAGIGPYELKILAAGFGAAVLAQVVPPLRFLLSPLATLCHEFGHTVASWLLGHPAVPAFDFAYGGGFTHEDDFKLPLALLVAGGWAWLLWTFRRNAWTRVVVAVAAACWFVTVSSAWRREIVVAAAGHLGELVLAAAFLALALADFGWRRPEVERPLGAFAGCFLALNLGRFAWSLHRDPDVLAVYLEGKGGALMNDLEAVSLDLRIHLGVGPSVETLAGWLVPLVAIPFIATLALSVYRGAVRRIAFRLLALDTV